MSHGFHSGDVVEIPTGLNCSVCPLYHVRRKNKRHKLGCREGRKNQICPILMRRQIRWAEELIDQVREATGEDPVATDLIIIEQIVRHRSRLFACENYLKVAGLIDLRTGNMRNVGERMTTVENALARSAGELRQAIESRKGARGPVPTLTEYLEVKEKMEEGKSDEG